MGLNTTLSGADAKDNSVETKYIYISPNGWGSWEEGAKEDSTGKIFKYHNPKFKSRILGGQEGNISNVCTRRSGSKGPHDGARFPPEIRKSMLLWKVVPGDNAKVSVKICI